MAGKERTFSGMFLCGDNRTTADWVDFATTDQDDRDCLCNVYACPQCGRITVLDAEKVVSNG